MEAYSAASWSLFDLFLVADIANRISSSSSYSILPKKDYQSQIIKAEDLTGFGRRTQDSKRFGVPKERTYYRLPIVF